MTTKPLHGGCACGAVLYVCDSEPVMVFHCHCRDCQRSSGAAMATEFAVPRTVSRAGRRVMRSSATGEASCGAIFVRVAARLCLLMLVSRRISCSCASSASTTPPWPYRQCTYIAAALNPGIVGMTVCRVLRGCRRSDQGCSAQSKRNALRGERAAHPFPSRRGRGSNVGLLRGRIDAHHEKFSTDACGGCSVPNRDWHDRA